MNLIGSDTLSNQFDCFDIPKDISLQSSENQYPLTESCQYIASHIKNP